MILLPDIEVLGPQEPIQTCIASCPPRIQLTEKSSSSFGQAIGYSYVAQPPDTAGVK